MRTRQSFLPLLYFLFPVLFTAGCGTTGFYVPVMKPAEVNLLAFGSIAIGEFRDDVAWRHSSYHGILGQDVADEITRALLASKRFDVLDRRNFDAILRERGIGDDGQSWGVNLERATCLLTGRVTQLHYDEQTNTVEIRRQGKPSQWKNIRTGMVRLEVVLQITNLLDGKILWNQRLRAQTTGSRDAIDAEPPSLDPDLLRTDAQSLIVEDFMRRIMPTQELMPVTFLTDDDMDELEEGIKMARKGNWKEAVNIFEGATRKYSSEPDVHRAWFNLGVAYQYNYDFRRAEEAFKKAIALKDETLYKRQLEYCYEMEKEYLEVLRQEGEAVSP